MPKLNPITKPEAFKKMSKNSESVNAVLLTSSIRLSRRLHLDFAEMKRQKGIYTWPTPQILPFSTWAKDLFINSIQESLVQDPDHLPNLLTPEQTRLVWERIIKQSPETNSLFRVSQIADNAKQAWEILNLWQIPSPELEKAQDQEVSTFITWANSFQGFCDKHNCLDESRLYSFLAQEAHKKNVHFPKVLILHGFYELEPALRQLLKEAENHGSNTFYLKPQDKNKEAFVNNYTSFQQEAMAAASWAREELLANPRQKLALIVPNLGQVFTELSKILEDVLHPEHAFKIADPENKAFNISLGKPLFEYPLIRSACLILEFWGSDWLDIPSLASILKSPYIKGADQEIASRAQLEAWLRQKRDPWVRRDYFLKLIKGSEQTFPHPPEYPVLKSVFIAAEEEFTKLPQKQAFSHWAESFSSLLQSFAWPWGRKLSSSEYQSAKAWEDLLSEFAKLDQVAPFQSYKPALLQLKSMLGRRLFQPESTEVPLNVLGLLEASGLEYDQTWVMGLHSDNLPQAAQPNPFLPVRLQKDFRTPRSSPEREFAFSKKLLAGIKAHSQRIIFSYPEQEEDRALWPSPLIAELVKKESNSSLILPEPFAIWEKVFSSRKLERIEDRHGQSLELGSLLSGGTSAIKDQSLCPFRAYAKHRLKAAPLEKLELGPSALQRGILVHEFMKILAQEIQTKDRLDELFRDNQIESLLLEIGKKAAEKCLNKDYLYNSSEFKHLEAQRLAGLGKEWLEQEKNRDFFEIKEIEKKLLLNLEGLKLKVRIDRLDRLKGENYLLIDYKTSKYLPNNSKSWLQERPLEPQLPMYALEMKNTLHGVCFAQINRADCKLQGLVQDAGLPKTNNKLSDLQEVGYKNFAELISYWQQLLASLSLEIQSGLASAQPISYNDACKNCELKPLCRINE